MRMAGTPAAAAPFLVLSSIPVHSRLACTIYQCSQKPRDINMTRLLVLMQTPSTDHVCSIRLSSRSSCTGMLPALVESAEGRLVFLKCHACSG